MICHLDKKPNWFWCLCYFLSEISDDQPKTNCLYTNVWPAHLSLEFIHKVLCGHIGGHGYWGHGNFTASRSYPGSYPLDRRTTPAGAVPNLQHVSLLVSAAWHGLALDSKSIKRVNVLHIYCITSFIILYTMYICVYIYIHINYICNCTQM